MFEILKLITVCSFFFVSACMSKFRSDSQIFDAKVPEGMTAIEVMQILGARGEDSFTTQEIRGMSRPFKFSDINGDGYLSEDEVDDTIKPRLELLSANMSEIFILDCYKKNGLTT